MKRLAMPLLAAVLMANLAGCGSGSGPTTGPSEQTLPDEVQQSKAAAEQKKAKGGPNIPY